MLISRMKTSSHLHRCRLMGDFFFHVIFLRFNTNLSNVQQIAIFADKQCDFGCGSADKTFIVITVLMDSSRGRLVNER